MTEADRIAYHTGLYNLPGDVPGGMWSKVGERLRWERGNRERLAAEQRAANSASGNRAPGGGFDVGQLTDGVGALIGGAGAVAAFFITLGFLDQDGWSALPMLLTSVLAAVVAFIVGLLLTHLLFRPFDRG